MSIVLEASTDPRVRRTRQLLQKALGELLFEKEFSAISVQDIAERATVNRATFYAHFADKGDLLSSLLKSKMSALLREKLSPDVVFSRKSLVAVATTLLEFLGDVHDQCRKSAKEFGELTDTVLHEEIYELVLGWLRDSSYRIYPDHSNEAVATMISWTIFGAAHRWSRGPRKRPPAEVAEETVSLLLAGSLR